MRLLLVGAPAAGKGTVARKLAELRGVPHIATGDSLREAIRDGTPTGLLAKEFVSAARLVPDDVVIGIIRERFGKGDIGGGYILDGFPRTVPQAEALEGLLAGIGQPLQRVILLECPDAVVLERITGRRTCEWCGKPYHVLFNKPKVEGVCDNDGVKLIQRKDDTEAKIRTRLGEYHSETAAIIPLYEKKGLVRRVDATAPPAEVLRAVLAAIAGL